MTSEMQMTEARFTTALIAGAGSGLSASLARALCKEGIKVALAARTTDDLHELAAECGAETFACDASKRADVDQLFENLDATMGAPEIVIYNASYRTRGPFAELDPAEVEKSLATTAFGGFLVAQQAVKRMLPKGRGAILFTGASASVKGYAQSAQSMARELHPLGIHVAHVVIDGGIKSARRAEPADKPASLLDPDGVAASYLHLIHQPHSTWSTEIELRPWVERF
jgi:NAD(P)-dependent dehydrogenase (short-subunit alcohol dehydrogenase family)